LNEAWNVLRDPDKRRTYDAEISQKKFSENRIVHEVVNLNVDFQFDSETNTYCRDCRCGGVFCVVMEDIDVEGDCLRNVAYDMSELIHHVLPYLHSLTLSSSTKRKKDVVYWNEDLFPDSESVVLNDNINSPSGGRGDGGELVLQRDNNK